MNAYTSVFGGGTQYPSDVSYIAIALTANITLEWPLEASTGDDIAARVLDVTPDAAARVITMPPADETAPGQLILLINRGPDSYFVRDNAGGAIITVADGESWTILLTATSNAAGTWYSYQNGSVTSQAQAASLAGFGLTATGSTLSQEQDVTTFTMDYTAGVADRAKAYVWTGGLGTLTLTAAGTLGNGWFMSARNEGAGNLTVDCSGGDLVNGEGSLTLRPGDSCTINCDGTSFFTVGLGQDPVFAFDFTSIDLTGAGATYTLSGAELNRIAYRFFGVLANNVKVVVPATTQQYWVANDTTGGSFTVSIATAAQASPVTVNRDARGIYYCQGSEVIHAETASIAVPIAISDGGTGATTASGARINIGGTATGIAVFTAASQAAARTAIAGAASGANSDILSLTGLTTPLGVAFGGTGLATTPTNGKLPIGNGTDYTLATLTQGSGVTITNGAGSITISADGSGGTVTSISGSGGTTGLTLTGGPITGTGTLTLGGTLIVANGGTGVVTLTGVLKGNGTSAFTAATAGTDYVAPGTATTFTAKQTFAGATTTLAMKLVNALEKFVTTAAAATGTINYDIVTQSALRYSTNASANWTVNFRGDGSHSLDSLMAVDESVTVVFAVKQGGTAFYNSAVQVDGGAVTPVWQGAAPTAGTINGYDIYSYVLQKTAAATFFVIASVVSFS